MLKLLLVVMVTVSINSSFADLEDGSDGDDWYFLEENQCGSQDMRCDVNEPSSCFEECVLDGGDPNYTCPDACNFNA